MRKASSSRSPGPNPFRTPSAPEEPLRWSPCLRLAHDYQIPPSSRDYRKDSLGDHALHYFLEGSGVYELEGETRPIRPGSLFLVRPGRGYHFRLDPGVQARMLNLHFDLEEIKESRRPFPCPDSDARLKAVLPDSIPSFNLLSDPDSYESLFRRIHWAAAREGQAAHLVRKGLMLELFATLIEASGANDATRSQAKGRSAVEKALGFLAKRPSASPSLDELAKAAGVGRALLCRAFRDVLGSSPAKYVQRRKLELASAELLHGDASIKDIAFRYGFPDVQSFTRLFKRFSGLPPGKYREKASIYTD